VLNFEKIGGQMAKY